MTVSSIQSVVIVGGGTAGWLTAGLFAAKRARNGRPRFNVTLIEPPDISPIGVGEGTWPSMRLTLQQIGVSEREFLKQTGASFKQGTKFKNWRYNKGEYYYHPFDVPKTDGSTPASDMWRESGTSLSFARFVGIQEDLCEAQKSPKMLTSRDFVGVTNYGYHFEADGMAKFLKNHCLKKLNVNIITDKMTDVKSHEDGRLSVVGTEFSGNVPGDFFVDCTGFQSLLIKRHYKARTISLENIFSCNRAVVARIPYHETAKVESTTLSSAQQAGWIWDVSLAKRFGVGYVHSGAHIDAGEAQATLSKYISEKGYNPDQVDFRHLKFAPGYVDKCWHKNCVAIGLSAGFVEPLEASSIMMTETAARELTADLFAAEIDLSQTSKVFNSRFLRRWEQVTHFLKFHYVMSRRQDVFWQDHRRKETVPETLRHDLALWEQQRAVSLDHNDKNGSENLFPPDSYRFIFNAFPERGKNDKWNGLKVTKNIHAERHLKLLPTNQEWLRHLT